MAGRDLLAVRVDGNRHIGLGHFFRCYHLAMALRERGGPACEFFMLASSLGPVIHSFLERGEIACHLVSKPEDPWQEDHAALDQLLSMRGADAVLLDLLMPDPTDDDLNQNDEYHPALVPQIIDRLSGHGWPLMVMSDQFHHMGLAAEAVVNTCPTQDPAWYGPAAGGQYLVGPDYYILPESFRELAARKKPFHPVRPKVVVFLGGFDHRGYGEVIVPALLASRRPLEVEVILGAATPEPEQAIQRLRGQGVMVHHGLPDLAEVLFKADLVISTAGNTLFDLAALGTPAAAVATRERQYKTIEFFADRGCCLDLGIGREQLAQRLGRVIDEYLFDPARLAEMSARGRAAVDGRGVERLAARLAELMGSGDRGC